MTNEIILNYIKANLGKDLNNDYNELGCAQTVNNILQNCLGYQAGGGPSTKLMLDAVIKNPNFLEVTSSQARSGDIILCATGTGNGVIDHGHVGFLGENGVIYSNNSITGVLDGHLTATQWKNYFHLKGGFPVRYFRAINNNIPEVLKPQVVIEKKVETPVIEKPKTDAWYQSSTGNGSLSLTVKGAMLSSIPNIILLAQNYGFVLSTADATTLITSTFSIGSVAIMSFGIVRKIYNSRTVSK